MAEEPRGLYFINKIGEQKMAIGWKIVIYLVAWTISSIIPWILFCIWDDSIMYMAGSLLWAWICAFLLYKLYIKLGFVHYIFCAITSSGLLAILWRMLVRIVLFLHGVIGNMKEK